MNSHWYCGNLVATKAEEYGTGKAPSIIKEIMRVHDLCSHNNGTVNDYDFLLIDMPDVRKLNVDFKSKDCLKVLPFSDIFLFEEEVALNISLKVHCSKEPDSKSEPKKNIKWAYEQRNVISVAGKKEDEDALTELPGVWNLRGSLVFENPEIETKGVEHYLHIVQKMNFSNNDKEKDLSKMYVIEHRGLRYLILQF